MKYGEHKTELRRVHKSALLWNKRTERKLISVTYHYCGMDETHIIKLDSIQMLLNAMQLNHNPGGILMQGSRVKNT